MARDNLLNESTYCSTPRRSSKGRVSIIADDSPTLSQEPINVTWKWGTDSPPVRNMPIKPKQSRSSTKNVQTSLRNKVASNKPIDHQPTVNDVEDEPMTDCIPTGLYKFHEAMQKIDDNKLCDIVVKDTGCPDDDKYATINIPRLLHSPSLSPITVPSEEDIDMASPNTVIAMSVTDTYNINSSTTHLTNELDQSTLKALKEDLLNDSDFDQVLLTCTEKAEANIENKKTNNNRREPLLVATATTTATRTKVTTVATIAPAATTSVKAKAIPTVDLTKGGPANNEFSLFLQNDESIDDLLGNIDDSVFMNSSNINNSKLIRHKSMPQHSPSTSNNGSNDKQNRKSFSRHESMPVNQAKAAVQKLAGQGFSGSSESMNSNMSSKHPNFAINFVDF